jgi:hypothetical protein
MAGFIAEWLSLSSLLPRGTLWYPDKKGSPQEREKRPVVLNCTSAFFPENEAKEPADQNSFALPAGKHSFCR